MESSALELSRVGGDSTSPQAPSLGAVVSPKIGQVVGATISIGSSPGRQPGVPVSRGAAPALSHGRKPMESSALEMSRVGGDSTYPQAPSLGAAVSPKIGQVVGATISIGSSPGRQPGVPVSREAAPALSRGRKPMESSALEMSRVGGDSTYPQAPSLGAAVSPKIGQVVGATISIGSSPGRQPGVPVSREAAPALSRGRKPMESSALELSRVGGDSTYPQA